MKNVRTWEIWDHLRTYLSSARMLTVLQGGKVYIESIDNYSQPDGLETAIWGRLVCVPSGRLWEDPVGIGDLRIISFLTRAEVHPSYVLGTKIHQVLEGIQDETYLLLSGHNIPKLTFVMGALPLWLARPAQALPLWDPNRGLYFTSAEWRCEIIAP